MFMLIPQRKQSGFTIIELLIVIVVIAILAAITLVTYNSIQARARDAARDTAMNSLEKLLEIYRTENGSYPIPSGCINTGCRITNLNSYLVPTITSSVPDDPLASSGIYYIWYVTDANGSGYALREAGYETKPACRYISPTGNTGWWADPLC